MGIKAADSDGNSSIPILKCVNVSIHLNKIIKMS
jgi:hypothetical protein